MRDRTGEARLAWTDDHLADLGVHAVCPDYNVRLDLRSIGEAQLHHVAVLLHIGEPPAERDRAGCDFFQDRSMQVMSVDGDVASAILLLACIAERQLEQDLAAVPFSAGECIGMDANLAQPVRRIEIAQYLHDVSRNVNASAYSFKGPSLFINPHRETLALQPSGGCRASKSGSDNCNAGAAPHLRHSPNPRRAFPHRGSTVQAAPAIFDV